MLEGPKKAFEAINDLSGASIERDLYIYAFDLRGITVAHGSNGTLVGKSLIDLVDLNSDRLDDFDYGISSIWQPSTRSLVPSTTSFITMRVSRPDMVDLIATAGVRNTYSRDR